MCILCVVSRWSRRVVTMLPWLVIPFIIIWAFSQLLPPGYRLEVTSTRLACLLVLLGSLFWYELLMPWLSSWRARRSALLRERKLIEAQEAAKWKKEATRRCRNCLTAYKVQSPGGGRFTCTYCGHVSKRPVLEAPFLASQAGSQVAHKNFAAGGQLSDGGLLKATIARHNESRCWSRSPERKSCWLGEGTCGVESCKAWQSFENVLQCIRGLSLFIGTVWRRATGAGRRPTESCRGCQKSKDDFSSSQEERSAKARKKAHDRRQARLERELLEAEEREQREEVAKLVEERRRQREEKLQVEEESGREAAAEKEREIRRVKDFERRRKDKLKERLNEETQAKYERDKNGEDIYSLSVEQPKSDTVVKVANSFSPKLSTTSKSNLGLKNKMLSQTQMRSESFKHGWNTKPRPNTVFNSRSGSQMGGAWNNTQADGQLRANKVNNATSVTSSSKTPLDFKNDGEVTTYEAGHGKVPQFNAWAKGSEALRLHLSSSNSGAAGNITHKVGSVVKDECSLFNNNAVGSKQTSGAVTSAGLQRPIARPSVERPSLHQLFSSPTIFPPLDLTGSITGQSKHPMQGNLSPSFRPEHMFFETPSQVSFQSCTDVSVSACAASPAPSALCSLPQITVNVDKGAAHYMDVSHHLVLSEPLNPEQSSQSMDKDCSPVKACFLSVSDRVLSDLKTELSPPSLSLIPNASKFSLNGHDSPAWDLQTVCSDKSNDGNEHSQEQIWRMLAPSNREFDEQVEIAKSKDPDTMELPDLSTVHSLFDGEILLPDSLSLSPQSKASILQNSENIGNFFENKSLRSDISAFDPSIQIWDDSDNNQKLPPEFVDCITQEIMKQPVITADGHSYERAAIEEWLKHHDTSPKTGEVLPPPPGGLGVDKTLRPNHILRCQIIEYNEKIAKM